MAPKKRIVAGENWGKSTLTGAISKADAAKAYPARLQEGTAEAKAWREHEEQVRANDRASIARQHYTRVELVHKSVRKQLVPGDFIEIHAENDPQGNERVHVVQIVDIFTNDEGVATIGVLWFYQALETVLMVTIQGECRIASGQPPGFENRIFPTSATDVAKNSYNCEQPLGVINRLVTVQKMTDGKVPDGTRHIDYWYDQSYASSHFTFKQLTPASEIDDPKSWPQDPVAAAVHYGQKLKPLPPMGDHSASLAAASTAAATAAAAAATGRAGGKRGGAPASPPTASDAGGGSRGSIGRVSSVGASTSAAAAAAAAAEAPPAAAPGKKIILRILELCCGAGGLSFLAQSGVVDGVEIEIQDAWAVDFDKAAMMSYKANHPETQTMEIGIDEYLELIRLYHKLNERLKDWVPACSGEPEYKFREILGVRLGDSARRGVSGQAKGQLQGVLKEGEVWLEFEVVPHGRNVSAWVKQSDMEKTSLTGRGRVDVRADLARFMKKATAANLLPLPGQVDLVAGGPPCQGVSGLNRHASTVDILDERNSKNRLVKVYFEIIRYLQPRWTLTEQVMDIFKKEEALYARTVAASLTALQMQCRIGVIAAGDHGCPQGRYRTVVWGAQMGCVLPSFPEPSHNMPPFKTALPLVAQGCKVNFLTEDRQKAGFPASTLGDVETDLPEVSKFPATLPVIQDRQLGHERAAGLPLRAQPPLPHYLRRDPPAGSAPRESRVQTSQLVMGPGAKLYTSSLMDMAVHPKTRVVDLVSGMRACDCGWWLVVGTRGGFEPGFACVIVQVNLGCEVSNHKGRYLDVAGDRLNPAGPLASAGERDVAGHHKRHGLYTPSVSKRVRSDGTVGEHSSVHYIAEVWEGEQLAAGMTVQEVQTADLNRLAGVRGYQHACGRRVKRELDRAATTAAQLATTDPRDLVQSHRSLVCNADDELRMACVPTHSSDPNGPIDNFRGMPGVVVHGRPDNTTCAGANHAFRKPDGSTACKGGGSMSAPKRGNQKEHRVDQCDRGGWRGVHLAGCPSFAVWMATGDLVCPRWCTTYKAGKSGAGGSRRHGCYGRLNLWEIQPTVVTRAEPHNLQLVHYKQSRVHSIRVMARSQGFPDYYVLTGDGIDPATHNQANGCVATRYKQMGNAVAPPMASALGRCLLLAASGVRTPFDIPVVPVPDAAMVEAYGPWSRQTGNKSWAETYAPDAKLVAEEEVNESEDRDGDGDGSVDGSVDGSDDESGDGSDDGAAEAGGEE
ncbi:MAG: hypothetical protein WDW36_007850 [Sanguina aurantia]